MFDIAFGGTSDTDGGNTLRLQALPLFSFRLLFLITQPQGKLNLRRPDFIRAIGWGQAFTVSYTWKLKRLT